MLSKQNLFKPNKISMYFLKINISSVKSASLFFLLLFDLFCFVDSDELFVFLWVGDGLGGGVCGLFLGRGRIKKKNYKQLLVKQYTMT